MSFLAVKNAAFSFRFSSKHYFFFSNLSPVHVVCQLFFDFEEEEKGVGDLCAVLAAGLIKTVERCDSSVAAR